MTRKRMTLDQLRERCVVDPVDGGCWHWRGHMAKGSKPTLYICRRPDGGRTVRPARQVAWELFQRKRWPAGMAATCGCGVVDCINPRHVVPLTGDAYRRKASAGKPRPASVVAKLRSLARTRRAKLTAQAVSQIRARLRAGELQVTLAREHGVSVQAISQINRNTLWREPTPWSW